MKLTAIQIEEAFQRAVYGESVRSIARSMAVSEGALRGQFKRRGAHPREVRRLAFELYHAQRMADHIGAELVRSAVRAERAARRA